MNEVIANLNLIGIETDGTKINIEIIIGKPYISDLNATIENWACPLTMPPLMNKCRDIYGANSLQSLCLANALAFDVLLNYIEKGGVLTDLNGSKFQPNNYGFKKLTSGTSS